MTKVKVTHEIDLDWESAQSVVVSVLKEDFDIISNDIVKTRRESSFRGMKEYEKEDLKDWMTTRDAIYNMLRYYLAPDELDMFMRNRSLL